ncbi:hypothetical protein [Pseudomonas leptonychotis]|uniref:hypothetical protein n=1 Tax=Pseudomonas leptonychotis TaxID=2448482 RepID=UPI00386DDA69
MNALQTAKASIQRLADLLRSTHTARTTFQAKRLPPLPAPRATTAYISGKGMVQGRDADTGRVLGFRQTPKEAAWLQQALENGTHANA